MRGSMRRSSGGTLGPVRVSPGGKASHYNQGHELVPILSSLPRQQRPCIHKIIRTTRNRENAKNRVQR